MSKTIRLTVNLTFSEKVVTDEDMQEIVNNVGEAIDYQIQKIGVAPEESDVLTDVVEVMNHFQGLNTINHSIYDSGVCKCMGRWL